MENESLKQRAAGGMLWGGLTNGAMQVFGALVGLVLMRLLSPSDYGKVAMLNIFSSLACAFQEGGFIAALCNRKEPTHADYNAVFWFNLMVSSALYAVLWFAAPLIADFYSDPDLTPLSRFLFLGFLLSSLGIVQRAYLFGHLMVKQTNICNLVSTALAGFAAIALAWLGFAYWGIVAQSVLYVLSVQLMSWHFSPWRPSLDIHLRPALEMFRFGSRLLVTNTFNILNNHAFSVLLGKCFGSHTAGVYNTARKWDDMASVTVNGMVAGVSQPVLIQVRGDRGRYVNAFRKMLRFVCFVSFPVMFGLGIVAHEFITLAGGEKWEESGAILSILCLHGAFVPVTTLYSSLTVSMGRSDANMTCTILQCLAVWAGLLALYPLGLKCMVVYFVALNIAWLGFWQWWAKRLTGLGWVDAALDILPFLLLAVAAMMLTWFVTRDIGPAWRLLLCRVALGAVVYVAVVWISGANIIRESIGYFTKNKKKNRG